MSNKNLPSLASIQVERRAIEGQMKRMVMDRRYWLLYCFTSLFLIFANLSLGGANILVGLILSGILLFNTVVRIKCQRKNAGLSLQLRELDAIEQLIKKETEVQKAIDDWNTCQ